MFVTNAEGVVTDAAFCATGQGQRLLQTHTLVLNRHWLAVGFTQVRRAIALVYDESAKVIAPDTYVLHDFRSWADVSQQAPRDECVCSVRLAFRIPEIILLTVYDGIPRAEVPFSRRNLCIRDRYACQYCGARITGQSLTIDHLLPRSRGGACAWENCVVACMHCNERKGNRTPSEAHMRLLRHPRRPRWTPSFSVPLNHRRTSWQKFIRDVYADTTADP